MKVKEESENVGLKLNIQKTKIMASSPIMSWQIDEETVETVADFTFLGSKITENGDCSHEIKRQLLLRRKTITNLQFSSVAQSSPTLCYPMNHSMPGLPVHYQLPESTQTHIHWVSDAIQPSHPLSSPSPPPHTQHQGLFQWVNSSHEVARVLEFQLQQQFSQWTPRTDFLEDGLVGSPCSPRASQESYPTPQFKSTNSLMLSFLHRPTLTSIHDHWKNHSLD